MLLNSGLLCTYLSIYGSIYLSFNEKIGPPKHATGQLFQKDEMVLEFL